MVFLLSLLVFLAPSVGASSFLPLNPLSPARRRPGRVRAQLRCGVDRRGSPAGRGRKGSPFSGWFQLFTLLVHMHRGFSWLTATKIK